MKPAQWKSRTEPRGHSRNRTLCVALQAPEATPTLCVAGEALEAIPLPLHRFPSQQVTSADNEPSDCEAPPEHILWVTQPFMVELCPAALTSGGRENQKRGRELETIIYQYITIKQ